MTLPVDTLQPDSLRVPLGEALMGVEECIQDALAWLKASGSGASEDTQLELLDAWAQRTYVALQRIYASGAPSLRFVVSNTEIRVTPASAHFRNIFNKRSLALVTERDALLALRERVADASSDLAQRMALHEELLREIRGAGTMTEQLWPFGLCVT